MVLGVDPAAPEEGAQPGTRPDAAGEATGKLCHRCGAELALDAQVCPHCGQKQYRQCFCGQAFPSNLDTCPACGTDWVRSLRVRRRSHSGKIKPRVLVRNALLGAFIAVLAAGLLNVIVTALAQRATPEGTVPSGIGERLYYAWYTLATASLKLLGALVGGLGYALLIALAGAAVGALVYLLPPRLSRLTRDLRHTRVRRRRSRR
ncbi:MAG: zinc ribbon domain-containing protein [Armatimonadetes bacterium]|nr:zinc ribbon domain-containing protein [Armatimonadota bacterium]